MADSTSTGGGPVFRLVYRSRLSVPEARLDAEVENILGTSRRNNPDKGITGALVVWEESVVQTLEGDETAVRGLYDTICGDSRHTGIELVEESPGVERAFGKWSMARVSDDAESDIPLGMSAWEGGPDTQGHRALTTPDEDEVITTMRDRVRGASA